MRLVFPIAVAVLDLGASIVYLKGREWALAITWFCYAIAAASLGFVK